MVHFGLYIHFTDMVNHNCVYLVFSIYASINNYIVNSVALSCKIQYIEFHIINESNYVYTISHGRYIDLFYCKLISAISAAL